MNKVCILSKLHSDLKRAKLSPAQFIVCPCWKTLSSKIDRHPISHYKMLFSMMLLICPYLIFGIGGTQLLNHLPLNIPNVLNNGFSVNDATLIVGTENQSR